MLNEGTKLFERYVWEWLSFAGAAETKGMNKSINSSAIWKYWTININLKNADIKQNLFTINYKFQ